MSSVERIQGSIWKTQFIKIEAHIDIAFNGIVRDVYLMKNVIRRQFIELISFGASQTYHTAGNCVFYMHSSSLQELMRLFEAPLVLAVLTTLIGDF